MPEEKLTQDGAVIYTVTQLTREIKFALEGSFPEIWVEGEVSNFKLYPSGHSYFSLKDPSSVINCVLFKSSSTKLTFDLEDGMHVLIRGRVSVYEKRGNYQLYAERIEPRGKGSLQLAFEQLKKKLYDEGLFSEEEKKPLPALPLRVGVVTSPAGAAIRDILKVAKRRFSNVEVSILPVRVQGDEAKQEIANAIKELNEYNTSIEEGKLDEHLIDVMIVGRGGGSLEDLWAFNEEVVARAIYASKIPVISAVGHEVDYTISDFVADFRAPTPSAAAELVMPLKEDLIQHISELRNRLYANARSKTALLEQAVTNLKSSYVLKAPLNVFEQLRQEVDEAVRNALSAIEHFMEIKTRDLATSAGKLEALSPLSVLKRGYSITFKDGKTVKKAEKLKVGESIETRFSSGIATSRVEKIEK